jgi:4-hydroxy-2-oxoheptanedioate aldolase
LLVLTRPSKSPSHQEDTPIDTTDDVFLDQNNHARRIRAVTVNSASPLLVSLAAQIGFEAIWIESEHGPIGFERAETLCLAAEAGGIFPLIRLPDGERHHILRALEIGARIILVPMVDDADYARRIVDVGKYPPLGHRGFNTRTRGMDFGMLDLQDTLARANNRTHLFAQIETTAAVAKIDEILAVDGLSGLFMGPGDLAVSMGRAGQMADPELRETVLSCMAKAKTAGKLTGIFTLPGPLLSAAMDAGCDLVVCGGDVMDLGVAWTKLLGEIPAVLKMGAAHSDAAPPAPLD